MIGALVAITGFIFIPFFAKSITSLVIGQVFCGMPWGVFQGITTAYAADVCPVALRAYLTTYINLCFVMGQLLCTGILRVFIQTEDQWSYRIPFAIQWVWPVPIMVGCFFAPESPWWLVRRGQLEQAKWVLTRLSSSSSEYGSETAQATVDMMVHTNELEKLENEGTSYLDCFKTSDLRRTEIACMSYVSQMICGSSLMGYSVYFYQQAGLAAVQALNLSIGQYAIGFTGTLLSWWLMRWFGRRTMYVWGTVASLVLLLSMGFVAIPTQSTATAWAIGSLLLAVTFFYDISVGPVCFAIVSEIPSTRLRAKTVVLARSSYNIAGIICNILTPRMINPTAWAWSGKAGFFWAGSCALYLCWMFFRLPEAKGRTYGELDVLFARKVKARDFAKTQVDQFGFDADGQTVQPFGEVERT